MNLLEIHNPNLAVSVKAYFNAEIEIYTISLQNYLKYINKMLFSILFNIIGNKARASGWR